MQVLGYATDISVAGLNAASNQQRANNGLAPYTLNGALNVAATNKAADMFADNYWAHTAPDGTTPWWFINNAGYSYSSAGENLAKNFMTSSGVVNGWMNSPGHRANVLNSGFVDVGYGVMNGILQGQEVTLVVAMYATPAAAPAPAPAPTPASAATTAPPPASTPSTPATAETAPVETEPVAPEETVPAETEEAAPKTAVTETETNSEPVPKQVYSVSSAEVAGAMISAPLDAYQDLNWGQKTTLFILATLALLFVMNHTLLWRAKKRGLKHIWFRAHPLAQASILIVATVVTLMSGTGVIL